MSMTIMLALTAGLLLVIVSAARYLAVMREVVQAEQDARSRIERQVFDLTIAIPSVTVTLTARGTSGLCLYHLSTPIAMTGHLLQTDITRTCLDGTP